MIKIMFVCYGNICRSPMAEFIMKDYVAKKGVADKFYIASSATHTDGLGCRPHRGTRQILDRLNIDYSGKVGVMLDSSDYDKYDYFIGMDEDNRRDMKRRLFGDPDGKVHLLLDFVKNKREVADPYWTGDFEATLSDVQEGVAALYKFLTERN